MKTNYHSHTFYCKHSENDVENLIKLAIKNNFKVFGISEHLPIPITRWMPTDDELFKLIEEVEFLKKKYINDIHIYMGLECEWHPLIYDRVNKFFDDKRIDYIIFGNHFSTMNENSITYVHTEDNKKRIIDNQLDYAKKAMESKKFSCYAHPDIFLMSYREWDEEAKNLTRKIANLSIENNVPLEINLNGYKIKKNKKDKFYYPCDYFWKEISKTNAKVIIGIDTHSYDLMSDKYWDEINEYIDSLGLRKNIIEFLLDKNKRVMK